MADDAAPMQRLVQELTGRRSPISCPVAALAAEAAASIRLLRRLRDDQQLQDRLDDSDDTPASDELRTTLHRRLPALEELASHHQARSRKGELFQILVAGQDAGELLTGLEIDLKAAAAMQPVHALRRRIGRMLYSVAYATPAEALDADLKLLVDWYMPRSFHQAEVIEALMAETSAA